MKELFVFQSGPMITPEQDIGTQISPFHYQITESYNNLKSTIETEMHILQDNCSDKQLLPLMPHDVSMPVDYSCAYDNANTDGFQVYHQLREHSKVHEDLYHKCYPLEGMGSSGSNGSWVTPMPDINNIENYRKGLLLAYVGYIEHIWKASTGAMLDRMFTVMVGKKYVEPKHARVLTVLFTDILEFNELNGGCIVSIEYKTCRDANTNKSFDALSISAVQELPNINFDVWSKWLNIVKDCGIKLTFKPVIPGNVLVHGTVDNVGETNWKFNISSDVVNGRYALVMTSCKQIESNLTYGLTIYNNAFTLDTASNIKMNVAKGTTFRFNAIISDAILYSITVTPVGKPSDTIILADRYAEYLAKYGIVIESITQVTGTNDMNKKCYSIAIASQSSDIAISLTDISLVYSEEFLPMNGSTNAAVRKRTRPGASIILHGYAGFNCAPSSHDVLSLSMSVKFLSIISFLNAGHVEAYAVPMCHYNDTQITEGVNGTKLDISSIVPTSNNGYMDANITLDNIPLAVIKNQNNRLLLRFVFKPGSMIKVAIEKFGVKNVSNHQFACQFEIDTTNGKVMSYYTGYTFGISGTCVWHPPIPMFLIGSALSITGFPYGKYISLNPIDRVGTLTLKEDVSLADVPLGIPADVIYKSVELTNPIDENKYFAYVRLPYTRGCSSLNVSTPIPTFVTYHRIIVKSKTRQLFNIVSGNDKCNCAYDETEGTAIYLDAKLAYYQDGYVLLPVFFSNVDCLEIEVMDIKGMNPVTFIIEVNLGSLPKEPTPDDGGNDNPENPDTDEKDEPLVDEVFDYGVNVMSNGDIVYRTENTYTYFMVTTDSVSHRSVTFEELSNMMKQNETGQSVYAVKELFIYSDAEDISHHELIVVINDNVTAIKYNIDGAMNITKLNAIVPKDTELNIDVNIPCGWNVTEEILAVATVTE